jgi:hypothetical protein
MTAETVVPSPSELPYYLAATADPAEKQTTVDFVLQYGRPAVAHTTQTGFPAHEKVSCIRQWKNL